MKLRNCARLLINAVVAISLCGFVLSCGGGGDSDSGSTPGKSGTITLSTSVSSLPADGTSSCTITATIRDGSGNPVRHYTDVTFTTTLGRFRNGSTTYKVQTQPPLDSEGFPNPDASPTGIVEVALIAGYTSGTAKVTVTSNGVSQATYVEIGTSTTTTIDLEAQPWEIPADGLTKSKILATVKEDGSPMPLGTEVTFRTTLGTFENGGTTYTVPIQQSTGEVFVWLTSSTTTGSAYVSAAVNGTEESILVGMGTIPVSISLSANPTTIPADGTSSSSITATVTKSDGSAVDQGTTVTFTTTLGTFLNGTTSYTVQTSAGTGNVSVSLISATGVGSARVTALSNGVTQSIYVGFGGAPVAIALTANPTSIWADGVSSSAIEATLTDGTGQPVTPGIPVTFTTTLGTFKNGSQTYTVTTQDATGKISASLIAGITLGNALVTATANGVTQSVYVTFTNKGGNPFSMVLGADPTSIPADGSSSSLITATLKDSQGNPVDPGTSVTFSTSLGAFTNGAKAITVTTPDTTGIVSVSLIAGTTAGSAEVTATATGVTQALYVTFGGAAGSITLVANPGSIPADGASSSTITATVKDSSGAPVTPGTSVTFSTNLGTFGGGGSSITLSTPDGTGTVSVSLRSSATAGTATVTASSSGVTQSVTVTFTGGSAVKSIVLAANPTSIVADGSSSSLITATLTDSAGAAVPAGTSVTFTTDLGSFGSGGSSATVTTPDATGIVSVSLISASTAGSATVIATSGGVSQSVNVSFSGSGIVATINLTANPSTLPADGTSTSVLRADVRDSSNNPVPDGTSISFVILTGTGTLSANTGTTVGGFVEVTYTASTTVGTETVRAMSDNFVSDTADITLTSAGVGTITLVANPNTLPADGTSSAAITASVQDGSGNPIAKGTAVTFTTTLGTFTGGGTSITVNTLDDTGTIAVSLISATTPGTATITAASGGVTQATTVTFAGGGQPASLSLGTSQTSVKSDNSDSATITATLLDGNNAPISGYTVAFSTTTGIISSSSATTNASGQAVVTFSSGTTDPTNRTALITATVVGPSGNITANIPVEILGSTLALSTDKTTIPSDGSITATLTATAREGGGTPVAGAVITFTVTGSAGGNATVTPTSGTTNASGQVQVTVTGTANGDVTVTADWNGTTAAQGYTVSAAVDTFRIQQPSADPYSTRTSASYTGNITFTAGPPGTIVRPVGSFTDDGFQVGDGIVISGGSPNDGIYTIVSITTTSNPDDTLTVSDTLTGAAVGVTITSGVMVEVYAPGAIANVSFTTTIGTWDDTGSAIITKAVPGSDIVKAVLVSTLAGTATVQAYDADNISTSDTTTISFSVPSGDAAQISLQASVYTVPPSVGGNKNTATLTATVRTDVAAGGQVVSGVAVSFSIVNPTGGGEYVVPVVVITNAAGQAQATFTSGALSTGAEGVTIRASVVDNTTITDTIAIVIGGTAGSVVIGRGTVIYDVNDATYRLPMAALVTDSNGNAISGAVVTLSTWPISYSSGVWYDQDPDPDTDYFVPYITGTWPNEDVNENLILDPGEDLDGNGELTPPNSSAGGVVVPSEVVTDENGVAEFDLYYLKAAAVWIVTRVRAQTVVVGTETTSSIQLRLPAEEQQARDGLLPDSAYPVGLVTSMTVPITYTFPIFVTSTGGGVTASNTSIAFIVAPPTITRADGGSFVTDGFVPDDVIQVQGSASNNGYYTLASVTVSALTLIATDSLMAEPVGATVTITGVALSDTFSTSSLSIGCSSIDSSTRLYTYDPDGGGGTCTVSGTNAQVGDTIWDWISVWAGLSGSSISAFAPVRIIIK